MGLDPGSLSSIVLVSSPETGPGGRVAFVATKIDVRANRYVSSLWLFENGAYRPLTGGGEDRCPKWGPQGLIAFTSRRGFKEGEKGASISIVSPDRGEPWILARLRFGAYSMEWLPDGTGILALSRIPLDEKEWKDYGERSVLKSERIPLWFNGEGWVFDRFSHLHLVEYPSGNVERLTSGEYNITAFAVSPDSSMVAYAASESMIEPYLHRIHLLDLESRRTRLLAEGYTVSGLAFSSNGERLYVRGHRRERGFATHHKIYEVEVDTGKARCITCGMDRNTVNGVNSDVKGPSCTRDLQVGPDGKLLFPVNEGGRVKVYHYDPSSGSVGEALSLEGYTIDEFSVSRDFAAFTAMSPMEPKELYIWRNGAYERVTDYNRGLRESVRRSVSLSHHRVKTRRGYWVEYWVLGPRDKRCERCLPWILYIHGGPKTSYGYGFMHEFHVLASNGFYVIYSNPRGSDGYTEEFADLRGRYGEDDYEELMLVVDDALSKHSELDPGRGGVTGGSYGGWMTNWIITKTSRFRAAATQRSCSNWFTFWGLSDIGWWFSQDLHGLEEPWKDPQGYIEKSPFFKAHRIETPLLIIHSTEDYRCPLEQAVQLFTALKVRGVKARIAIFPGENHDLSRSGRPRSRIERLQAILEWFKENLGNGGRESDCRESVWEWESPSPNAGEPPR